MEYRELRNGGVKVSAVILGAWQFSGGATWGGEVSQKAANEIVAACFETGINTFDTAEVYGKGRSETILGAALKASGVAREEYVIATKLWGRDFAHDSVVGHLESSLEHLGTEYIDIYQIHWPPVPFTRPQADVLIDTAHRLLESGKIRAMAVSNFRIHDLNLFDDLSWMASNQIPYNLVWRYYDVEGAIEKAHGAGVGHLAYSPLAQGLLTGRFGPDYVPPEGHTRSRNRLWRAPIYPEALKVVDALKKAAAECGKSPSQTAVNWILHRPGNFAAIVGASSPEQVRENAQAAGWRLDDAIARRLDDISLRFHRQNLKPEFMKMWGEQ
jgi:myo-inositol catabolism protein IolS